MPLISVIIPCFNASPWIKETIQSVLSQDINDLEIILVDDGSTDGSTEIVKKDFPSVRLIRTKNQGPSKTRNLGTKESKGEFIQYLDADDLLAQGKLKLQIEKLKTLKADVCYGDWQKLIAFGDGRFEKGPQIKRVLQNPEIDLFTDFWCPPATYLFKRSIIEKIGGWNERLPIIQDARFTLDCALHGAKFVHCAGIMAYYRLHTSGSVSSHDSIAFNRDILNNAIEIEEWWQVHGGINNERKNALLKVYGYVARSSFTKDRDTFDKTHHLLKRLSPRYAPERPRHLRMASKVLGYKKAELVALWYRRVKAFFVKKQG